MFRSASVILLVVVSLVDAVEPWATYRGNPQRTGNTDGIAGPTQPQVLWVLPSKDHFIASPVPHENTLLVSGLGAFNVTHFYCLNTEPGAPKRIWWEKTTPFLRLPVVSSPAIYRGRAIFGDGMHQTDGANLHCLQLPGGLPLWQLPVPGKLVHLEGTPTIDRGRVYMGGGAAGVICVDLEKVTLEGKEMDLASVQKILSERWQQLLKKYEEEKKKDPDFALPPTEDQLPRPSPRRLWQQGQEAWHVDAPVALVGERVLAGSAFLDKEQVGERALFSLEASTGKIQWKAPLKFNPWGGPSVQGQIVVVAGSSISYDPRLLKGAKGQLVALALDSGKELWKKDLLGGVVGSVAIADGAAIVTATDGKVRAFELDSGERRWVYEAGAPLFAPPAVAARTVYAGDLRGVLHAIDLKNGDSRWKLDLGSDPAVKAPGMIYGGPIVHGGRIYVATCNLEGAGVGRPTAVVCIGTKK